MIFVADNFLGRSRCAQSLEVIEKQVLLHFVTFITDICIDKYDVYISVPDKGVNCLY